MPIQQLIATIIQFYSWVLFAYIILSWFPAGGVVVDLRAALATICEPYLSLFRRIIPPVGMMDFSPIVGFVVLNVITRLVLSF